MEDYTAAIECQPGFEVPYYNRGLVLYRLGMGRAELPRGPGLRASPGKSVTAPPEGLRPGDTGQGRAG